MSPRWIFIVLLSLLSTLQATAEDRITCSGPELHLRTLLFNIPPPRQRDLVISAIAQAQRALERGNAPFGAILVNMEGTEHWWAHNTVRSDKNPLGHAEINVLREASAHYRRPHFHGHGLVTNAEPCAMCALAAINFGINFFIYGAPAQLYTDRTLTLNSVINASRRNIVVIEGIEAEGALNQIRRGQALIDPD